jgi:hypothetical protein
MFNPTVVEAVDAYLSTPDEEFMSSRFDGVIPAASTSDSLRDSRIA